jgi:hypothetical protein
MAWLLQAAGVGTTGLRGELTVRGLVAVWVWTLRAWERDESADLSATMAALDSALRRAEQAVRWLQGTRPAAPAQAAGDVQAAGDMQAAGDVPTEAPSAGDASAGDSATETETPPESP